MLTDREGKHFAYVEYATNEEAEMAATYMNGGRIDGEKVATCKLEPTKTKPANEPTTTVTTTPVDPNTVSKPIAPVLPVSNVRESSQQSQHTRNRPLGRLGPISSSPFESPRGNVDGGHQGSSATASSDISEHRSHNGSNHHRVIGQPRFVFIKNKSRF